MLYSVEVDITELKTETIQLEVINQDEITNEFLREALDLDQAEQITGFTIHNG